MSAEPLPGWLYPEGGLTAADLDRLPGLPEHTELIDGGLFFMSPQRLFHLLTTQVLDAALKVHCPPRWRVRSQMSVVLDARQRFVPDVFVVRADVETGPGLTSYPAEAVQLVAEVVSPESELRDRERKPQLYARAGITHFWRVEEDGGRPVVYVYELDPATGIYALTGIHHDRLTLTVPFAVDVALDLTGL
jgi:Uma2 family endonuclease